MQGSAQHWLRKRGDAPDLVQAAILRFNLERAKGELDDDASAGLAIACSRITPKRR